MKLNNEHMNNELCDGSVLDCDAREMENHEISFTFQKKNYLENLTILLSYIVVILVFIMFNFFFFPKNICFVNIISFVHITSVNFFFLLVEISQERLICADVRYFLIIRVKYKT